MRNKSLRTLLVAVTLSVTMLASCGPYIFTAQAAESPAQPRSMHAAATASMHHQTDGPIVGLNFRTEGSLTANQPVTFVAEISGGSNVSFRWDFGDGSTPGQGNRVVHTYANSGVYNVTLIAENNISIKTATRQIDVSKEALPSPIITITGDRRVGVFLNFEATVNTNARIQIIWEYGDGEEPPRTGNPTTHSFDYAGTFVVTAEVVNLDDPTDRSSATELVTIVDEPIVGFSKAPYVDPSSKLEASNRITFKVEVNSGSNVSYRWNFGDGTPSQTTENPVNSHIYEAPGIYKVIVNAFNSVSNIDNAIDNPLYVEVAPLLEALDKPTMGCIPTGFERTIHCFVFVDKGEPATYRWNFGDGATALGRIVKHSFGKDGKYNVRVVAQNQHPDDNLESNMAVVEISAPPEGGDDAVLLVTTTEVPLSNMTTWFTLGQFIPGTARYVWDFGDDSINMIAEGPNNLVAFHIYNAPGQYVATVRAEDADGNVIQSADVPILVSNILRIPFVINPQ